MDQNDTPRSRRSVYQDPMSTFTNEARDRLWEQVIGDCAGAGLDFTQARQIWRMGFAAWQSVNAIAPSMLSSEKDAG